MSTLNELDVSTPLDGESASVLAAEVRHLKLILKNVILAAHQNDGTLKAINTSTITPGAVGPDQLDTDAVTEVAIADGAVTTPKIADDAVTAIKLANNAVDENKIATDAVTNIKIKDNAVTGDKIASDTIDGTKIKASPADDFLRAIGTDHIKDGAITDDKIFGVDAGKLTGGADASFLYKIAGVWTPVAVTGAMTYDALSETFVLSPQLKVASFGDSKARGSAGGATTANTWVNRTIAQFSDVDNIMDFTGNQFTLAVGDYLVFIKVPASGVGRHQARLYVDKGATNEIALWGSSMSAVGVGESNDSFIIGLISVADEDWIYRVQHWCQNTVGANDLGVPSSSDNTAVYGNHAEIYTKGYLVKLV